MSRLRSWLAIPSRDGSPTEILCWVRRMEITGGFALLAGAALAWSNDWLSWLLLGAGLLSVSPWPGASAILRKAQTRPEILASDPDRRRRRGRLALKIIAPAQAVIFTVFGYVTNGWGGAAFFLVLALVSCGLGTWIYLRMETS